MRYSIKELLPEVNRVVAAFNKDGEVCITFRSKEQENQSEWILEFKDGNLFIPTEWEYIDVDYDKNDSRCPLEIAMENYARAERAG